MVAKLRVVVVVMEFGLRMVAAAAVMVVVIAAAEEAAVIDVRSSGLIRGCISVPLRSRSGGS